MPKSKIEWTDYSINPIKGRCPNPTCPLGEGCYARRMYKRFKWNPEIRMEPDWQEELPKAPAKVFVGSTMELFDDWVEDWMWDSIWQYVNNYPQHTFIFLTKHPQNLVQWSPFPENCWVGVSATNDKMFTEAIYQLQQVKATIKYISFEPLLGEIRRFHYLPLMLKDTIQWVIIGQQTPASAKTAPKISWIQEILVAAHNADDIPVFIKDNLRQLIEKEWPGWNILQEFPK